MTRAKAWPIVSGVASPASVAPASGGAGWLVTFVDVVMLLLTFFILLYAMSRLDAVRYQPIAQSYIETFRPVADDQAPGPRPRSYVLEMAGGEDLAYLENVLKTVLGRVPALSDVGFRLTEQSLILSLPRDRVLTTAGDGIADDMSAAVFDLGGVLANVDNRMAVTSFVDAGESSAAAWAQAVRRAGVVAGALSQAGYARPIAASAAMAAPGAAAASIDVVIMAEDDPRGEDGRND